MKYWDTCAVEALIRGRFGIVTDKDKNPVIYKANEEGDYTIPNGLIIARNQQVYDICYKRAEQLLKSIKIDKGRLWLILYKSYEARWSEEGPFNEFINPYLI